MFEKLSRVYGALSDAVCKAKYDQWLKAKDAAKRRTEELDEKRRKFKQKLEKSEGRSSASGETELYSREEVDRLREAGQRMIQIQMEELRKRQHEFVETEDTALIQVTWNKAGPGNYTQELLEDILGKFGHIQHIIMSKKRSLALVEFTSVEDAMCAVESQGVGHDGNPLVVSWKRKPRVLEPAEEEPASTLTKQSLSSTRDVATPQDYESIVLARLQRAQEQRTSGSACQQ